MKAYKTVNKKSSTPKGFIHKYNSGNDTLCGKHLDESWLLTSECDIIKVTCPFCKKILEMAANNAHTR